FPPERHERFAVASGDFNPIHMDPVAARRTQTGEPVVHGIHALLAVLDAVLAADLPPLRTLRAEFRKPIYVGGIGAIQIIRCTEIDLRARLVIEGAEVLIATLGFTEAPSRPPPTGIRKDVARPLGRPLEISLEDLEGLSGRITFSDSVERLAALFPCAA